MIEPTSPEVIYGFENITDPVERAIQISMWGQIDGGHHKMWVIDQMVRALLGDRYNAWVAEYEADEQYEWDTGITP